MWSLRAGQVLTETGLTPATLHIAEGRLACTPQGGRQIDLPDHLILPGIVDIHGDGFERHMAPRRGVLTEAGNGVIATEAEMAANGITTGVMAQFFSWEGGMRGPDFAEHVCRTVARTARSLATDLRLQLRIETHMLDDFPRAEALIAETGIGYVVFNDHLQHDRLAIGARPRRLTGQALKAGRNPDDHFAYMIELHRNAASVPAALDALCGRLIAKGVRIGSHDDPDAATRAVWAARGALISEFPESLDAAGAAQGVIMGAPNLVRGSSHKGNVSAAQVVSEGLCHALASDYHYPSLKQAAFALVDTGTLSLEAAWHLISRGPAQLLGLDDRGTLSAGKRADFTVLDPASRRIELTVAAGQVTYASGEAARQLL